jgi:hypothetical protein
MTDDEAEVVTRVIYPHASPEVRAKAVAQLQKHPFAIEAKGEPTVPEGIVDFIRERREGEE